ncbi:MAG: type IX secretion system membrane protein PorP/SprF [candidate division KSB1 bacterium]|nr:type IX secretion system membrane protein PorP/SprF [candidate division KSB1 bacterium]MDZ7365971.1 type IX secretion system membrane protein PorP/SprF [candidate division KSB1 bacterium]MDZ7404087.1 type IX secretion system membrane protein PorP/SprF [candidate division KSB1 bacterium]
MSKTLRNFIAIAAVLTSARFVAAQNLIFANAADRGDARAGLLNPAVAVMQDPLFTLGSRALHYGVLSGGLDLRHSYFSVTTSNRSLWRFDQLGYGLQGQVLQTPLYNAVVMNAVFGKKLHENFAAAVNVGFSNRAFDRSQFVLEAEDDPALARLSKWIFPDLGFGVVAVPHRYLTLAFNVAHLTRSNVSMYDENIRQPVAFSLGAAIGMGYFRALIGVSRDEGETLPVIAFESFRPDLGFLKIAFGREAAALEGSMHVMQGVSLSYRYNYPMNELRLASSGSHEVGLSFNFRKNRTPYAPEWLKAEYARREPPAINPATAFVVRSVFDTLKMVDKFIFRKIDPSFTAKDLAGLPANILFSTDSLEPALPQIGARHLMTGIEAVTGDAAAKFDIPRDSVGIVHAMQKDHTKNYLEFLRNLAQQMKDPAFHTRIIAPADEKRVYLLLKYLSLYGPLNDRLEIARRDSVLITATDRLAGRKIPEFVYHRELSVPADTFKFALNLADMRRGPVAWAFIIEDAEGRELLKYAGEKQIPRRYVWNWRWQNGELPLPGAYYYYLRWQSADGQKYTSPRQPLIVSRENRRITIEIMRRKDLTVPKAERKTTTIIVN